MKVYLDESGYTGEDLLNPAQPVLALASNDFTDSEAAAIYEECFKGVRAKELKHSSLGSRKAGQNRVIRFLEAIKDDRERFYIYVVDKKFACVTNFVDIWVETAMHHDGYNLYRDGAQLGFANVAYMVLSTFLDRPDFSSVLRSFQKMMRTRSQSDFAECLSCMCSLAETVEPEPADILRYFIAALYRLGYGFLLTVPEHSLDTALACAFSVVSHWRRRTNAPFHVVHDRSSAMAKEKWLWEAITSPSAPPRMVDTIDGCTQFPLNVEATELVDSKRFLQVQLSDVLAGAATTFARGRLRPKGRSKYADRLRGTGIFEPIGCLWPSTKVTPEELGTKGKDFSAGVSYLADVIAGQEPD